MKHRIFTFVLALIMLLGTIPAAATETTEPTQPERAPGYCGESVLWTFSDGMLTITGTGRMDDFPNGAPWEEHKDEIETVIISGGITYVGAHSFYDYDKLKNVEFGTDIREIGERAFLSCDGLTVIYLPASFKIFGHSSFMGCSNLKEFHFEGTFPTFIWNSMWDVYATFYFPADRPWSLELIKSQEEAFKGRIEFLASDGTDPYEPTEATEETEAPTEEPTEEPTEPPTTAPPTTVPPTTEAPTEEVTEPVATQAPTEEPTEEATEEPTEPEPEKKGGSKIPLFIVGGVAAFLLIGSLIFGGGRKRGKYSR